MRSLAPAKQPKKTERQGVADKHAHTSYIHPRTLKVRNAGGQQACMYVCMYLRTPRRALGYPVCRDTGTSALRAATRAAVYLAAVGGRTHLGSPSLV